MRTDLTNLPRLSKLFVAALSLAFAPGCSGSSAGTTNGSAGSASSDAGSHSGSAGTSPASAGNGGSSSNAGSASGGAAGGGIGGTDSSGAPQGGVSAGGGGDVIPTQLLPLAVGNRWTYQVTGGGTNCADGMHDATIVGMATQGGEQAFEFRDFCKENQPSYLRDSGDEILEYQAEWARSFAAPLQEGYSWMFTQNYQLQWHFVGSVTVPAGTFNNCWQRLAMSMGDTLGSRTYCPGVGPVQSSYTTGQTSLVSYALQ